MPGSTGLAAQCQSLAAAGTEPLVCSREALAHVLRSVGPVQIGNLIGLAAFLALPSVLLMLMFGQKIGSASGRERVGQYVYIWLVADTIKKTKNIKQIKHKTPH